MAQPLRLLVFSSLYPSAEFPRHGIFLEHRTRSLAASGNVEVKVICPVPWFPLAAGWAGTYGRYARVPKRDRRHGIDIVYPRYPVIPKIGMTVAPLLMAAALLAPVKRLMAAGFDFDVLDSYYMYPDGVAAAWIARRLGKPYTMTAFGSDIHSIPRHPLPRRMIRWAARHAGGLTAVCQALKDAMVDMGIDPQSAHVVLHGVDLTLFSPATDRPAVRARLGMTRRTLLSVGHLIELKGHHIAIEALTDLPETDLFIAGDGADRRTLEALAERLGVGDRVRFLGLVEQTLLPDYYRAADALVLCSSREGIPNVIMESMACGTPVLAMRVWGTPEVVNAPAAGLLIDERTPAAVAAAARALFAHYPDRAATRAHVEAFTWERTSRDHMAVVGHVLGRASRPTPALADGAAANP